MIIPAPRIGPMIAGCSHSFVNTRESGSRCRATGFTKIGARVERGKSNRWTRLKRRTAQGVGAPRAALAKAIPTPAEGNPAMPELKRSLYATPDGLAVTPAGKFVTNRTVLVVA